MRYTGMTLVEILVTISIIAVLMGLLFPVFHQVREKGRQTTCLSNQRQIAMALLMEARENNEDFPPPAEMWNQLGLGPDVLVCPTGNKRPNSYAINANLNSMSNSPTETILTGDAVPAVAGGAAASPTDYDRRHNGAFIASFLDGHAQLVHGQ